MVIMPFSPTPKTLLMNPGKTHQVTHYPLHHELLRGRGRWDAARIITVTLVAFSVASWVLELSLSLTDVTSGPVDMMDRPPPVLLQYSPDTAPTASWMVRDFIPLHTKKHCENALVGKNGV